MNATNAISSPTTFAPRLWGCVVTAPAITPPSIAVTPISNELEALPAHRSEFVVAVCGFKDLTGQRKPSDTVADLSTAVTQGGGALLVGALMHASKCKWFRVVEREGLQNLLQERQPSMLVPQAEPKPGVIIRSFNSRWTCRFWVAARRGNTNIRCRSGLFVFFN